MTSDAGDRAVEECQVGAGRHVVSGVDVEGGRPHSDLFFVEFDGLPPGLKVPPLKDYVSLYEHLGSAVFPTKVIGICLNTYDITDEEARKACKAAVPGHGALLTVDVLTGNIDAVRSRGRRFLFRVRE